MSTRALVFFTRNRSTEPRWQQQASEDCEARRFWRGDVDNEEEGIANRRLQIGPRDSEVAQDGDREMDG